MNHKQLQLEKESGALYARVLRKKRLSENEAQDVRLTVAGLVVSGRSLQELEDAWRQGIWISLEVLLRHLREGLPLTEALKPQYLTPEWLLFWERIYDIRAAGKSPTSARGRGELFFLLSWSRIRRSAVKNIDLEIELEDGTVCPLDIKSGEWQVLVPNVTQRDVYDACFTTMVEEVLKRRSPKTKGNKITYGTDPQHTDVDVLWMRRDEEAMQINCCLNLVGTRRVYRVFFDVLGVQVSDAIINRIVTASGVDYDEIERLVLMACLPKAGHAYLEFKSAWRASLISREDWETGVANGRIQYAKDYYRPKWPRSGFGAYIK